VAVVGIDLGTTNTVVGIVQGGKATAIRDADGEYLIPSVVSFHPNGTVLVGRAAKERRVVDASNTIYSIKRLIGRSWNSEEVGRARSRFPFEMREGPGQAALVLARGETFTLPEISAFVLRHAKALAEKTLGEPVDRAVITVPANFNDLQRAATKVAGRVAGLEVLRILNEPTAAALAYGYGRSRGERIAIYDFGGGTFDVTLLDLSGNVFEVLATAGNTFLGGDDIDLAIAEKMADACLAEHGIDARADTQVFERLRYYAEKLKVELSTAMSGAIDVPDVGRTPAGKQIRLSFPLSRDEIETLARPVVERTFDVCADALSVARLDPSAFDQVVLVGGSTRLPVVRRRVTEYFGRAPLDRINPDEVVAIGAAIQANALTGAERRRSVIPRPPMPAARSLEESVATTLPGGKSRPPPHPNTRGKTDPFGKVPPPLAGRAASRASSPDIEGRRRAITGMGLGPAPGISQRPPLPERKPPPARKGGTLGGVGNPGPPLEPATRPIADSAPAEPMSERSARRDGLPSTAGEWDAKASLLPRDEGAGLAEADDEATRVRHSPSEPTNALSFPPIPTSSFVDDEPTHVGAPPEVLARARTLLANDFEPNRNIVQPTPVGHRREIDSIDALLDEPLPAPTPVPRGAGPRLGFQRTMLGASPPREPPPPAHPEAPTPEHQPSPSPPATTNAFSPAPPEARQLALSEPPVQRPVVPLLVDVTPLSLCVETVGGFRDVIIARNTPVPCEQSRSFVTAQDNQQVVRVRVGQGEAERFAENIVLGELELSGLRRAARGEAQFVVTFTLDTDGMLEVRARDPETGNAATARLRLVGLPDAAEVGRMSRRHLQHPAP
jgi:molecular chaperone DnaK